MNQPEPPQLNLPELDPVEQVKIAYAEDTDELRCAGERLKRRLMSALHMNARLKKKVDELEAELADLRSRQGGDGSTGEGSGGE